MAQIAQELRIQPHAMAALRLLPNQAVRLKRSGKLALRSSPAATREHQSEASREQRVIALRRVKPRIQGGQHRKLGQGPASASPREKEKQRHSESNDVLFEYAEFGLHA
jgi:hypothetical protein